MSRLYVSSVTAVTNGSSVTNQKEKTTMAKRNESIRIVRTADDDAAIARLLTRWRQEMLDVPYRIPEPSRYLLAHLLMLAHRDEDQAWEMLSGIPL